MSRTLAALAAASPAPGGGLFPGLHINTATIIAWIIGITVILLAVGAIGIISSNKHGQLGDVMRRLAIMAAGVVVLAVAVTGGFWALAQQASTGLVGK